MKALNRGSSTFLVVVALQLVAAGGVAMEEHLLFCEAVLTPTAGEFLEIANPTNNVVVLGDYYVADNSSYYLLPAGLPSVGQHDFVARFPDGAQMPPGEVAIVTRDASAFKSTYPGDWGGELLYELIDSDGDTTNDMRSIDVGGSSGFTDGGEGIVLFEWDGTSDLVRDVDMMRLGQPTAGNDLADKTGQAVDSLTDGDDIPTTYQPDASTMPIQGSVAGSGVSTQRLFPEGIAEIDSGGNGLHSDDETSENILRTWDSEHGFSAPDPGCCIGVSADCYYEGVVASDRDALRSSLHALIEDHERVPWSSTNDTWKVLEVADENPNDPYTIVDVYRNESFFKKPGDRAYQREHSWPSSHGFPQKYDDAENRTEFHNYPYSDCHHLFLAFGSYNGSRGNNPYRYCPGCVVKETIHYDGRGGGPLVYPGDHNWRQGTGSTGSWETWRDRRGDVARALFYLDVRYEGGYHQDGSAEPDLVLTDEQGDIVSDSSENKTTAYMGMRADLLQWHHEDPVDAAELRRNNAAHAYQLNRNPFVDHPEWVDCAFGDICLDAAPCDASITVEDGVDDVLAGQALSYTIEVANTGPQDLTSALVQDALDPSQVDLSSVEWTCAPAPGSGPGTTCPVNGDAVDLAGGVTVAVEVEDAVIFDLQATLLPQAGGDLIHTARVMVPTPARDPDPWDNRGSDRNGILGPCGEYQILDLRADNIADTRTYQACQAIEAGPAFEILDTGNLTLEAGSRIVLRNGFGVRTGGALTVEIDPTLGS